MPDTLNYLASPYTLYPRGLVAAFQEIAAITGKLRKAGIFTFSPIVHSHSEAVYAELDPLDLSLWYPYNKIMMERCDCLIVAQMEGWDQSDGVRGEIEYFLKMEKPIFDLNCESLTLTKRRDESDPRMQLTLDDVKAFSGGRRELPPLAFPDAKGQ